MLLFRDFLRKALARGLIGHVQKLRHRRGNVAEAHARSEVHGPDRFSERDHRDILSRVVGVLHVSGVAAVVRRDDDKVVFMELSEEARQPLVKFVQRLRVAIDVSAMAVEHVKVHEIHEAKARKVLVRVGHRFFQPVGVSRRVGKLRHAAAGKNIVDLADGDHVLFRVHNRVQNRFLRRLDRKIVPSRRSRVRPFTGKGSGDDPSHAMLAHEKLSRNAAVFIELLGRDNILVRGDLEEGVRIAQTIEPYVDLIHVSAGTYQLGFGDTHPSMFRDHGCNVYLAAEIKKHVSVPVATIGGLNDPAQMEEIISSGKADIVYMARALLADPFLPRKVVENRENEIVKCLRCFTCMAERAATSTRRCTVNPLIGREIEGSEVQPASVKKKVLVAGGGPGGLYAAYTAARRGHQVILCEKEAELGGILKSEKALPFKQEMYELSNTYALFARNAGVEIRTSVEVTPEYVEKEAPDALIIAVGSQPLVPPIKGLRDDNVVIVNNYYLEKEKVTDQVVVFGGGLAGCECAIHLGQEGKQVHLVEMRTELAPDANVRHRPLLLKEIEKYVTVHTGYRGLEVRPDGVLCETEDKQQILVPGTSVICALGQRSRTALVDSLRDSAPFVRVIGDANRVSTITNAVYEGYHAALDI